MGPEKFPVCFERHFPSPGEKALQCSVADWWAQLHSSNPAHSRTWLPYKSRILWEVQRIRDSPELLGFRCPKLPELYPLSHKALLTALDRQLHPILAKLACRAHWLFCRGPSNPRHINVSKSLQTWSWVWVLAVHRPRFWPLRPGVVFIPIEHLSCMDLQEAIWCISSLYEQSEKIDRLCSKSNATQ